MLPNNDMFYYLPIYFKTNCTESWENLYFRFPVVRHTPLYIPLNLESHFAENYSGVWRINPN